MTSTADNRQELENPSASVNSTDEDGTNSSGSPRKSTADGIQIGSDHGNADTEDQTNREKQDQVNQNHGVELKETEDHISTSLSSVDILRIKNKFLEIVEEIRILRGSDIENEQRIKELVAEKHDMERQMEDTAAASNSKSEQHEREICDIKKQLEEKLDKLESEKHQTTVKTDIWEKEAKALKEELRKLLVVRYTLEKSVKEQEHRIQMQSSTNESQMSQMKDLEGQCKEILQDCNKFREQLTNLDKEVKSAIETNKKLSRFNTHQQCIITSLTEENQKKQAQIVQIKAESGDKQYEESALLSEKHSVIQQLREEIANMEKVKLHLEDRMKVMQDEQQKTLAALSESHLLADRYLNNSLHSAKEVGNLKTDLEKARNDLQSTKERLTSTQAELEALKMDRESTVTELKKDIIKMDGDMKKLHGDYNNLNKAFHNVEELNSSWAKKNNDLTATVKKLTQELQAKETQLQEIQLQAAEACSRPETREISTSTEKDGITTNTNDQKESAALTSEKLEDKGAVSVASEKEAVTSNALDKDDANNPVTKPHSASSFVRIDGVQVESAQFESNVVANKIAAEYGEVESDKAMGEEVRPGPCSVSARKFTTLSDNISKDLDSGAKELESSNLEIMECHSNIQQEVSLKSSTPTNDDVLKIKQSERSDMPHKIDVGRENQIGQPPGSDISVTMEVGREHQIPSSADPSETTTPENSKAMELISLCGVKPETEGVAFRNQSFNQKDMVSCSIPDKPSIGELSKTKFDDPGISGKIDGRHSNGMVQKSTVTSASSSNVTSIPMTLTQSIPAKSSSKTSQDSDCIAAVNENITAGRFKRLPHLTSPPLISLPVLRRDVKPKENSLSFTLPSFGLHLATATDKESTSCTSSQHTIASKQYDTLSQTSGMQALPSFGSNPVSLTDEGLRSNTTLNQEMSLEREKTMPHCSSGIPTSTSKYTSRWSVTAGGDHQDTLSSRLNNSQEQWPDFVGEFSGDSNSQHSVKNNSAITRQEKKRPAEETTMFSDEEDDDDLKVGVASQIERIQVFLKNDRLKRPKKNNKEPVV